jgi:hypothetical protein
MSVEIFKNEKNEDVIKNTVGTPTYNLYLLAF